MINAQKDYLSSIFSSRLQYIIPFFQRPYVWKKDNWEALWENVYQTYLDNSQSKESEHFIGTIIMKQQTAQAFGDHKYELIDGQQRITSFALLLKALAQSSKGEFENLKKIINDLLMFEDAQKRKHLCIIHNRMDEPYFDCLMKGENSFKESRLTNLDHNLIQAYNYFYEKVKNYSDETINNLHKIVLNKVPIISMILSPNDDEQVIFDTINSLGVRLTTADLLKNYIFQEEAIKNQYDALWANLFESDEEQIQFWNKRKTAGRVKRTNIEVLLYSYLILKTSKEVSIEFLFKEYKMWLSNKSIDERISFLNEFKEYSKIYYSLPEGNELNQFSFNEHEKRFFHIIENLNVTTAYPLILFLYKQIPDKKQLVGNIKMLESYLIRRNICRMTTKNYNNIFLTVIAQLKKKKTLKSILQSFKEDSNYFPSNKHLNEAFQNSHLSNQNAREILYCITLFQQNSELNDQQQLSSSNFSVKHIMPQKWKENWSEPNMTDEKKYQRDQKLKTLGNLTLITQKLNSKLKNDSWKIKKKTLDKFSTLKITIDYLSLEEWDESTISKRANDLYNSACKIWKEL